MSPYPSRRSQAARALSLPALLIPALLLAAPVAVHAQHADPPHIQRFMWAIGEVESGGDYTARNRRSGAYGRYQMLPKYWRAWAERYLGDEDARPTRRNQDRVARGKFRDLYRKLGSWEAVAHAWLTGSDERDPDRWSRGSKRYVRKVILRFREALREGHAVTSPGPAAPSASAPRRTGRPSESARRSAVRRPAPAASAPGAVRMADPRPTARLAPAGAPRVRWPLIPDVPVGTGVGAMTRPGARASSAPAATPSVRFRWTTRALWVRTAPGEDGRRLRRIEPGTRLGILSGSSSPTSGMPAMVVTLPGGEVGWLVLRAA